MTSSLTLSSSKESEMMVLGCVLGNPKALKFICEELDVTDFYYKEHKIIFQVLLKLFREESPSDVHLLCEELKYEKRLKQVGGASYIVNLAQYAGTSTYIEEYAKDLRRHSNLRRIQELGVFLQSKVSQESDPEKILQDVYKTVKKIESSKVSQDKFLIKFLNNFENNFLLSQPPKKAMLLNCINTDNSTGFLPKGIVSMLVAAGGLGKTHLLAQLAVAIATGTPWLDQYFPTQECGDNCKGNVFFGLGENQFEDIHRILFKAAKKLQQDPNLLHEAGNRIAPFSFCGQQATFLESGKPTRYYYELKTQLEERAPSHGWSLIILDPVSRLLGANAETDNAAATQFIALLEALTIDLPGNPTVLFAHHVNKTAIQQGNKQDQSAARGSSALTDGVRWQLNLSRDSDGVGLLKMTKSNFTAAIQEIRIKSDEEGFLERLACFPKPIANQKLHTRANLNSRPSFLDAKE